MYRIRIHGRGGQGIKMASRVLGTALFRSGFTVQDAPKYGAERRGAPIFSTVRAARATAAGDAIKERGVIHRPDLVVVADDTLLAVPAAGALQGITAATVVLVNSPEAAETWRHRLNLAATLLILPATEEAQDRAELPHIGATCAGAAACLLGVIEPATLEAAIGEELASLGTEVVATNRDNALTAFDAMTAHRGLVVEGTVVSASDYKPPSWIELPMDDASIAAPDIRAIANSVQVRTGLWRTLRPVIDYDRCSKCWWVCSSLCPDSAIAVEQDIPMIDYDHCKGCMICVGVCPPHAIGSVPEYLAQQQEQQANSPGEDNGTDPTDR
ncbi:MAG: 2-oxoacid:acceptor oxidoreductase family protein [Halioglobus sp.]